MDKAALTQFLDGVGFHGDPISTGFGIFNGGGIIFMIVGIGFTRKLADRFGKRNVFSAGLFASTLFLLAFVFFPPEAIGTMMLSHILHGIFY